MLWLFSVSFRICSIASTKTPVFSAALETPFALSSTIVNDYGKFALHTLPSGVFYEHTTSVIGNGVALNIPVLFAEIQSIVDQGVPAPKIFLRSSGDNSGL